MDELRIAFGSLLCAAGAAHFVLPTYFRSLVPTWIPQRGAVVAATGVADITAGALILRPATASVGGWAAALIVSGYLTSHVDAAWRMDPNGPILLRPSFVALRLATNVGYIAVAVMIATTYD